MSDRLKSPWIKYYGKEKQHLEYPDFSVYKLVEFTSSKHLTNTSYNYYGTKKTYYEFLKQIDEAARAFKSLGIKHKLHYNLQLQHHLSYSFPGLILQS